MNRTSYTFAFLMILQFIILSSVFGQTSVFSQKRGGIMINIDDTPDSDAKVASWESYRLLFNKYGYKFNIGLQSEGLNRPVVAAEVKLMMNDGHEMMDHCPQNNISEFSFNTHLEDTLLYIKKGVKQPGVESVDIGKDQVFVKLKIGLTLDPTAIPVLAERTRLLYRRYLKDSIHYPKVLAQPGEGTYIAHSDGYIYLNQAGYTACAYDGLGRDEVISKTYNVSQNLYHPAFNIKRADWGNISNFQTSTNYIADNIARHQVVSILFHYPEIDGTYLDATDKFLKWCKDNDVPLLTISQWTTNLNNNNPDPKTNVFPDITKDLDGDGKPDGYETFYDVTIKKTDSDAPGGSSLTKYVGGNIFEILGLGGIEKGKNIITFSAKGQSNATIRVKVKYNKTDQTYCDTTITLNSTDWKIYKATFVVPDNTILSDVNFLVSNIQTGNFVSISDWQFKKGDKEPVNKIPDATITIKQTILLSAEPGCTNYRWSTGETIRNIVFDGTKSGPGIFPISYTADDQTGASIADDAVITVKGLLYSKDSLLFPFQNSKVTLKITGNIPWTITTKKHLATVIPSSGNSSTDVTVSMAENITFEPIDDFLTIYSSQDTVSIPIHQAATLPQLSINNILFNNIPRKGKIESVQITSNTKWKISSKPNWITISSLSGNGNALITFTADSNKLATERTANIIIKAPNGQKDSLSVSITLYQLGEDQYLNLEKNYFNTKAFANAITIKITSNSRWTLIGVPDWIIPKTTSGSGNNDLLVDILANPLRTERTGTFKITTSNDTTRIVTVMQLVADYIDIDRKTIQTSATSKTETVSITSSTDWTVTHRSNWITVSPSTGTKNSLISLVIQENLIVDDRKDTITIKAKNCQDQVLVVTQSGITSKLEIDKSTITVAAAANTFSLLITTTASWTITDVPSWIKPSQLSGVGNLSVTFAIDQNKLQTARPSVYLKITANNGTPVLFEVKQEASPTFINPTKDNFIIGPADGDTASIFVSSNIKWKIINTPVWIKTNPDTWISQDGDKKINIILNTQWYSKEDITGVDIQGTITLEEDSSLPNRIIKTITVTLKSYPAVLKVPSHSISFKGKESTTLKIESNLPWTAEKKTLMSETY